MELGGRILWTDDIEIVVNDKSAYECVGCELMGDFETVDARYDPELTQLYQELELETEAATFRVPKSRVFHTTRGLWYHLFAHKHKGHVVPKDVLDMFDPRIKGKSSVRKTFKYCYTCGNVRDIVRDDFGNAVCSHCKPHLYTLLITEPSIPLPKITRPSRL